MSNLVIELTRPSGFLLPSTSAGTEEEKTGKMLLPGENTVSAACWEEAQKNPGVRIAISARVLLKKGEGEADETVGDWNSVTLPKAAQVLVKIEDLDKLHTIKKKAKKKGLVDLVSARIESVLEENTKDAK